MANHPNRKKTPCRPREHLVAAGRRYPNAWKQVDLFRADRDRLGGWPDYIYLPMAAWYAIVSHDQGVERLSLDVVGDVAKLAAIGAWRFTQGIYRFDSDIFSAVWNTAIEGDLPCDLLHHLPEWCVYVEVPDMPWGDTVIHGFWAHLEQDANNRREELRLLLDTDRDLFGFPFHLGQWSLGEAIERFVEEATRQSMATSEFAFSGVSAKDISALNATLAPMVSLLLYIASQVSEIGDGGKAPAIPKPKKTKKGWKLFPPDKPNTWDVGVRMGAALRAARQRTEGKQQSTDAARASVKPHIRNAHWHTFIKGNGENKTRFLKWLPPIPVKMADIDPGDLPAVIKKVKK